MLEQRFELPPAEVLNLAVLGEKLPVYSGFFQATGMLVLKHPLPEGKLLLPGLLTFQQCSDALCEPPQVLPFELSLTLDPFIVSERDAKRVAALRTGPTSD